ncbi:hypothetical protein GQ54DRAFT_313276 [Martensiomyces pterosporus]|nr:hypothetical protein GQ54DRAFT_313276 [Martensiomyces pterosporus]
MLDPRHLPPPPSPPPSSMPMDEVYVPSKLSANSLPQNSRSFHVHNSSHHRLTPGKESPRLQPLSPSSPEDSMPSPQPLPQQLHHHSHRHQYGFGHIPLPLPLPPSTQALPFDKQGAPATSPSSSSVRKRSRHAWPAEMTREIINVLLDEFLNDPSYRTTIYRSRDERDHRFIPSGRSILEEYNKVQNIRRRYFIPLSYLLQWDQLRQTASMRSRQRANVEKKLAKPLERTRLQTIFRTSLKGNPSTSPNIDDDADVDGDKPVFELNIFVGELKRRDPALWARGVSAYLSWSSRKCSIEYIINH